MGGNKWTTEQSLAISERNCDLLISAAAGSGKTAVLVERIIGRIIRDNPPMDVDRMLVVTFTNAAAAEMSERIGNAIAKNLETQPENIHLQNQLTLLGRADIKTIHAFCLQVIREYYHILEIDPATRTADPTEVLLLQKEVLADYFESLYSKEDEGFFVLLETFGEDTKDNRLQELVLQLYEFVQGYPNPKKLLVEMAEKFHLQENETINHCPWISLIREGVLGYVELVEFLLDTAMKMASTTTGMDGYLGLLEREAEAVEVLKESLSGGYMDWHRAYVSIDFGRLPPYKGDDKEIAEQIKSLRNEAKDVIKKLGATFFCYDENMQTALVKGLYPIVRDLGQLVIGFMDAFAEAKKDKLILDFHDYEHFCLRVLVDPESTLQNIIPTEAALELQNRYDEIMIDEYQDSNMVQEMILASVSKEGMGQNNRFMVGDVKQSIYRFRLAMPELFNAKYNTYPFGSGGKTQKIVLSKNFRSRKNVLDGINFICKQAMSAAFGDVEYNEEVALYAGATFPETEENHGGSNEIILVEKEVPEDLDVPEEYKDLGAKQLEALVIAKRIQDLVASGYHVFDGKSGTYRPVEYGDIVVLFRGVKSWVPVLEEVFGVQGIPFYAESSGGHFDVVEVDTILQLLRILDNPYQDIPLLTVLFSPLYGVTADEMILMRQMEKKGLFFECLLAYMESGEDAILKEKLTKFYEDLMHWRNKVKEVSLYELISYLYEATGYYQYVGLTAGGDLRQANLQLLLERAEAYEKGSLKGLFYFIRYVEDLQMVDGETSTAKLQSAAENLVRVMTIHKSKGLEFPVVIIGGMGGKFNEMDLRKSVIAHQVWGMGLDYTNLEQRAVYRTLAKTALVESLRLENLSEELRVLYVAMTRAKEKMILIGNVANVEKSLGKWQLYGENGKEKLPIYRLRRAHSYLDWVMPALQRHPNVDCTDGQYKGYFGGKLFQNEESTWKFSVCTQEDILGLEMEKAEEKQEKANFFADWKEHATGEFTEEIKKQYDWAYPNLESTKLVGKSSISELKRKNMEVEGVETQGYGLHTVEALGIQKEKGKLTAAQIGTATHTLMQYLDFQKTYTQENLQAHAMELVEQGTLSVEEEKSLHYGEMMKFFKTDLAKDLQKAEIIERERPFAMLVPANEVYQDAKYQDVTDEILINGIVDCYYILDGEVVLVDYKSDRLYKEEEYLQRYQIQMELYALALGKGLGKPVSKAYIYSFALGKAIEIVPLKNKRC
ncbi:helicase-exonuclease AddAB subunit AddA [Chakrabartyella piscis]|uniref:helicase-exonuclease AddAB subunit AddA n=1 Tax=Chakrabartyella piscis TaxID=2918914 RepID=UPI002958AEB7|nr:helicase-exonuclease AddAB subunit AddA [Chakrabartyella piscis]